MIATVAGATTPVGGGIALAVGGAVGCSEGVCALEADGLEGDLLGVGFDALLSVGALAERLFDFLVFVLPLALVG